MCCSSVPNPASPSPHAAAAPGACSPGPHPQALPPGGSVLPTPAPAPVAVVITDSSANPAPLGLLAFGMTTTLLNLHNVGAFPLDAMIVGMGIFYGGLAQVVAGVLESKKGNTFGTVAFCSYGFFWLSLATLLLLPKWEVAAAPSSAAMGAYLAIWGLLTAGLTAGTGRSNRAVQLTFVLLLILFGLLAAGHFAESAAVLRFAGAEGILCGLVAIYAGLAAVLNETCQRPVLPVG